MKILPSLIAKGILAVATGNTEIASFKVGARAWQADGCNMLCPGGISDQYFQCQKDCFYMKSQYL